MKWIGVLTLTIGVIAFGVIPPAFVPAAEGGTAQWHHITERVYWTAGFSGAVLGFGLAFLVISFAKHGERPSK